jgi:tetratricopeptide (TPR) repeat protein
MTLDTILKRLEQAPAVVPRRGRRRIIVPAISVKEARALIEAGKSRTAYDLLTTIGELKDFSGAEALLLAGDVADDLGAAKLARHLHFRAWRSARNSPEAQVAGLCALWQTQGLYATWRRLRALESSTAPKTANGALGTHRLWLLRAYISAGFQDFESAERYVEKARDILPESPAIHVAMAYIREREFRFDEALACAEKALELRLDYPRCIRCAAHLLQLLNRDEESLALLAAPSGCRMPNS